MSHYSSFCLRWLLCPHLWDGAKWPWVLRSLSFRTLADLQQQQGIPELHSVINSQLCSWTMRAVRWGRGMGRSWLQEAGRQSRWRIFTWYLSEEKLCCNYPGLSHPSCPSMSCQRCMPHHHDLWYYINESSFKHQSPFCTMVFKIIKSNAIVFLSELLLCFPNQASTGPVYMPLHWSSSTPQCLCPNPVPTICEGILTLHLDPPYTPLMQLLVLDWTDIPVLGLTSLTRANTLPAEINLSTMNNGVLAFVLSFSGHWMSC